MRLRLILIGSAALSAMPAQAARTDVTPYLEVQQVINFDVGGNTNRRTNTYTGLAAGVNATIDTRRASATADLRYEHRFSWGGGIGDQNIYTGLARGRYALVPDLVTLEGGFLATRSRTDIRGAAPALLIGNESNLSQVFGIYAGPTITKQVGDLNLAASYRFGYVAVKNSTNLVLPAGQPRLDLYDSSTNHTLTASVNERPGPLPFGWTVSAGYQREDVNQLDQRYEGKFVQLELLQPVSPTLALVGSVGYEKIEISQRAPLVDATGAVVLTRKGRYVTDPSSPRLLAYDTDGLIYDGGIIWRPNRHTSLTARVGYRYGGTIYNGSFNWRINKHSGLQIGVYDQLDSFGRGLTSGLGAIPTQFAVVRNPFGNGFTGCVFGTTPGEGGCLDSVFQSINTANYRSRGVYALYSAQHGPWTYGLGGGYSQRKYIAPRVANVFSLDGVKDESYSVQGNVGRRLDEQSGIDLAVYGDLYKSGILNGGEVRSGGATASYYRTFGERLSGNAGIGIYAFDGESFETDVSGTLLLGMRYVF